MSRRNKRDSKKILIADDDTSIVRALDARLRAEGHETLVAFDGRTALELAQSEQPDVILLDVSMPAENGHTVTRVLKRTPETMLIQIIVMTANSSPEHFDEAMRAGACAFLEKPFEDGVVLPLIDSAEPLPPVFMEDALAAEGSKLLAP